MFKARFSVYHNTLDNGAFTYVSAFLAVTLTAFLYIYKIKKDKRAENIIVEHRQYGKPLVSNSLMTIWVIPLFIFIRIGMSISNENYMSDEVVKINYTVTCKGERSVKGGTVKYLCINDGERDLTYDLHNIGSHYFSVGDEIFATARRGYWGYLVIQELHKKNPRKPKKTQKELDIQTAICEGLSSLECALYFSP
ncbi:hypothetical protein [Vibrio fortis]|uniref:hypothetical protein n=1 Tax=Vibrio fortis TaxID=212667 RepID=UPI0038CD61EC